MDLDGLLLIDKPSGWTSFDVVAKVRGVLKQEAGQKVKVGHTGTLDPLATGLMIVVLGSFCKRAAEFSKLDKTYDVRLKLGETSTTGDEEGEKTPQKGRKPTLNEMKMILSGFVGENMQTPPAHSAVKVNGQRAYKLARAGKEVSLQPRKVLIYSINLEEYNYPRVRFTTRVSSGTYIRSLAQDMGERLGTGAYMSGLRRTEVGEFRLDDSVVGPEDFSIDNIMTV